MHGDTCVRVSLVNIYVLSVCGCSRNGMHAKKDMTPGLAWVPAPQGSSSSSSRFPLPRCYGCVEHEHRGGKQGKGRH